MKGSKKEEGAAIGIDLGTTSSCVGVFENDRVHIIPNHLGYRTTASYVSYEGNRRLVGDGAKKLTVKNPSNTIFDTKRLIGRRFTDPIVQADMKLWPFRVIQGEPSDTPKIVVRSKGKELQLSAEEISSMILEKMKETAEDYLQKAVKKAVITVPAYFNESQRQATKDAGAIAGLDVIRIINEPTAAAIAYGLDKKSNISGRTNVLVFDLGGGTFDVSLMTIEEGNIFQVKAVAGDAHLGGEDFDDRMVSDCVREFKRKFNKDLTGNQRALGRLRVACEKAKKELSYDTMTSIELDCLHDNEDFSMIFRRNQFDKLNVALFKKCIETVKQCLRDANMDKSSVDEVILVGGSTRIPKIKELLREFFDGRDVSASVNPDEAVACGAAIMAAKLSGSSDKSVKDLILSDVTPLSLGVALRRDVFDVVIPRNTPIPTKKSKIYLTTIDNQFETCIEVYQGERIKSTDNHLLGKFLFSGIPPAPKGKIQFEDSFEIDADGILTVTSKILSTGKTEKITITSENGRLSKEEIEKMIKDAEMYKREDQEFRNQMDAYNELQDRLDETENMIDDSEIKKRVHTQSWKKIEDVVADTTEWLHDDGDASVNDLKSKQATILSSSVKRPQGNGVSNNLVNTSGLHGPVRKSKRMKLRGYLSTS